MPIDIFPGIQVDGDTRPQSSSIVAFLKLVLQLALHIVENAARNLVCAGLDIALAGSLAKLAILLELRILDHPEGHSSSEDSFAELVVYLGASISIADVARSSSFAS